MNDKVKYSMYVNKIKIKTVATQTNMIINEL